MAVVWRSSIFRECQTSSNYDGYVKKAFFCLEQPTSRETKAVAMGRFRHLSFIRINIIAQLREKESRDGASTQMAFTPFLLALRGPSGASPIRRAYRNDDLE